MTRSYSESGCPGSPAINTKAVTRFFEERAGKISSIGPLHAVIYQEKNAELAQGRDIAEKAKLLPLLRLDGAQRVLDVGCGTGRWASELVQRSAWYHGIDACAGLVDYAREQFSDSSNCRFSVMAADDFSLDALDETGPFDRVLCAGVLIYLNDAEVRRAIRNMAAILAPGGLVMFREPMGVGMRLTISEHYSEEMEQQYSAIYRTHEELERLIQQEMPGVRFKLVGSGGVYDEPWLNNRSDTRQMWFLMERIS
ncbi:methyltransferase domain-containing protein [Stenotrophomonas sp. STM01]|uniref:class I SAM-dependent methyltransferase n=1 Tax=Stenotrophomonas sp. STM01 TaxID=2769278 RepID=UPI001786FA86|nr:class I SAM-dependent methyltransferase [Stenotrophomonas sp. STM01]MBD9536402.1 methyltransferase domain-containing protein [Stenotrophomonas sp. STM01]